TGFPFKELERIDLYTRQLQTMMKTCAGVRRAGAAALDLAYVACGRLDAFWGLGLSPWDMAAGALLIQEAGGLVGDLKGDQGFMDSGDMTAATTWPTWVSCSSIAFLVSAIISPSWVTCTRTFAGCVLMRCFGYRL